MLYYLGETFDKEKNKTYKTLEGGQKAAEQKGLNLYDENGKLAHEGKKPEVDTQKPAEAPEGNQTEDSAQETEMGQEGASDEATGVSEEDMKVEDVTLTDDVPEDALILNEDGQKAGEQLPDVTEVRGKVRRIFDGLLRIRKRPSWDDSACIGVTKFVEKDVVALHQVGGKPMYETLDGYFITADETLVKFTTE